MGRTHSRESQLFDLANIVEDEMTLVSDPLYSRDAATISYKIFETNSSFYVK